MRTRNQEKAAEKAANQLNMQKTASTDAKSNAVEAKKTPSKAVKADDLVNSILSTIQKTDADQPKADQGKPKKLPSSQKTLLPKVKPQQHIRGQPKSGRPWKEVKQKFSKIKKSIYRPTFEKKEKLRHDLQHIKELSKSVKEDRKVENEQKRQRREENAKRRLENERKNEIVQIIKNPAKLKRMKKKALRKIEKRDLATVKTVQ